ncbi:MAG: hypothetical protein HC862_15780 [Scytonema sp. RU_4_4]|nr:hypothetical protein [Scytonema sp. RU_4_4]
MTTPDFEEQLLRLPPSDKLHLIQVLAQSLNTLWVLEPQRPSDTLSNFFRQSPLCQVVETGELDLSRDRSLPGDRFIP